MRRAEVLSWTAGMLAGFALAAAVPAAAQSSRQEAAVVALVVDSATQAPTLVLEGRRDGRRLAMAIGPGEAASIALALEGRRPPRPLAHDLLLALLGGLQVRLERVLVHDLRDSVYLALVRVATASGTVEVDARPSDAIALALRARVPVLVEDRVFDKAAAPTPRRPEA